MIENLVVAGIAFALALVIILPFKNTAQSGIKLVIIASVYHLLYIAFLFIPIEYPVLSIDGTSMNWVGKVLAIIFSVITYYALKNYFQDDLVISKPREGSWKKVITVGGIVLIVMCALTMFFSQGKPINYEKLAYQLTMPGIDEELWRGILLSLLIPIVGWRKFRFGHPAVWAVTVVFALAHSLYFQNWEPGFAIDAFIVSTGLGYMLGWMTYYSRSILPALIFHNLINFSTNFIEMVIL